MATTSHLGLPPVPPELKAIIPYVQRADELSSRDPIMSYWCAYTAAQTGIALKSKAPAARTYLFALLSLLEKMKAEVVNTLGKAGGADAVEDEAASAAYVENFGLRVFEGADSEDRRGMATRATAKKFLAAANFLEMLKIFDKSVVPDTHDEKIRYAKWKAADIAKAFREGRKPTPGPAGSQQPEPEPEPESEPASPPLSTTTTSTLYASPSPSTTGPKLAPGSPPKSPSSSSPTRTPRKTPSPKMNPQDIHRANAISPPTEPATYTHPVPHSHIPKHLQDPARPGSPAWSTVATPGSTEAVVGWDPSAKKTSGLGTEVHLGDDGAAYPRERIAPDGGGLDIAHKGAGEAKASVPPSPPTPKRVHFTPSVTGGLTESEGGSTLYDPEEAQAQGQAGFVVPPPGLVGAEPTIPGAVVDGVPLPPGFVPKNIVPTHSHSPVSPAGPSASFQPPPPPSQPAYAAPPPPPPILPPAPPEPVEVSPQVIAQTQKHCRYAISALDYEDVETARKELRIALGMLGGL
ncbi:DUF605-domain-containing protein [Gloeophyllum trabeum ATCC 11539]|uniref:DUF605-domain-containing protein n=1 Tax=Gloeophyllum trabeum (strain ATCC 11539 / FP-39264 / Madison 617) TaxID=670483 RepID=S7QLP5_GLOTA|nr:DUF605-domain-containing protein [Gloeophyllum trabeum ATCC 11539]EPQ60342.1 DUF605-domain-containing protein [Gloeophyllum trabeum ATCC 11539]